MTSNTSSDTHSNTTSGGVATPAASQGVTTTVQPGKNGAKPSSSPLAAATKGICNNISLPIGLVVLAGMFRQNIFKRKKKKAEGEGAEPQ